MYCCNNGDAIASAKTYTNATGSTVIARILQAFYNFAIKNPKTTIIDHAIKTFHNLKWPHDFIWQREEHSYPKLTEGKCKGGGSQEIFQKFKNCLKLAQN
jgi:hypothetical protein